MVNLSVNINKIATLRNARGENFPNLVDFAVDIENFGANGITVHPRPDERHIKYKDVFELKNKIKTEFNIEGNPSKNFLKLVKSNKPTQVTLVPDGLNDITSNKGWDTIKNESFLKDCIKELKESNIRTSIFVDPNLKMIDGAKKIGSDRIELYTKSYADNFNINPSDAILPYLKSSKHAQNINIEINAGHDLNLKNIEFFSKSITNLKEVSIGHALICESLYFGIENTVKKYISILNP
ncbi:MAG: pyridoxine 5'-phosphate synthase [Bacteroidota bacterium]|nr:pyridoxine 5'-phosphate synthase [Flavobacteriaceae bacterium]MEC8615279.1 pyridoxine 5'-phosphate synthase [Bacteroidota bacterium]|tara:strand:- start:35 stop:751 length:717 start_codon:yes stop_codon:yes gene_type:complete